MIDRDKARELRAQGCTYEMIAATLGCTESGAYYAVNTEKVRRNFRTYNVRRFEEDQVYAEKIRENCRKAARRRAGIKNAPADRGSGPCEICGRDGLRMALDHDHGTGFARGWLCVACNRGVGYLQDSPDVLRRAVAYLENGGSLTPRKDVQQ